MSCWKKKRAWMHETIIKLVWYFSIEKDHQSNTDNRICGWVAFKINLIFAESPSLWNALEQLTTSCIFHHYCQMGRGDENLQKKRLAWLCKSKHKNNMYVCMYIFTHAYIVVNLYSYDEVQGYTFWKPHHRNIILTNLAFILQFWRT